MGFNRSFRMVVVVSTLVTAAGTGVGTAASAPEVDALVALLTERGIARAEITVQDSRLNYAGPNCPGAGWSCVPAGPVVQRSAEGANVFECSPEADATATPTTCSVVQSSSGGTNVATCEQFSDDDPADLTCAIEQANTTGPNSATVTQAVSQASDGDAVVQFASVTATIDQTNGAGSNDVIADQSTLQTATANALLEVSHDQNATMCLSMDQSSVNGDNLADIDQEHAATSELSNVLIADQRQQDQPVTAQPCADGGLTEPEEFPNLHVRTLQFASGTGALDLSIDQSMSLTQEASSLLGPVDQLQGPAVPFTGGGVAVELDGDTLGPDSSYTVHSSKDWRQEAGSLGPVSQTQNDRQALSGLGLRQGQRSYDDCVWTLETALDGSHNPDQTFLQEATSHCTESTLGTITNTLQGDQTSETFTDEFVNETRSSGGAGAPPSGPGPFPHLHKAVANLSNEEGFGGPESPSSTEADPGDTIGYFLIAHNHGGATATGLVLTDTVPPDTTFAACQGGCVVAGTGAPGDEVMWSLPDLPPGGSAAVSMNVVLDPNGDDYQALPATIPNVAWLDIAEEPPVPSNEVTVEVAGVESLVTKEVRALNCGPFDEFCEPGPWGADVDADAGELIEYRIAYSNDGGIPATGVIIADQVPGQTVFHECVDCGSTPGGDPPAFGSPAGTSLYWQLGEMAPGEGAVVTFVVLLDANDDDGWACSPGSSPVENAVDNVAEATTDQEGSPSGSNAATVRVPIWCDFLSTDALIVSDSGIIGGADGDGVEQNDDLRITFNEPVDLVGLPRITVATGTGSATIVCNGFAASCSASGSVLSISLHQDLGESYPLTVIGSRGVVAADDTEPWNAAYSPDRTIDGPSPTIALTVVNLDQGTGGTTVTAGPGDTLRFSIAIANPASASERMLPGSYGWSGQIPGPSSFNSCTGCGSWFNGWPGEVEWYSSGPHANLNPGTGFTVQYEVTATPCWSSTEEVTASMDTDQAGSFTSNTVTIEFFGFYCEA